jgi:hypothetical protein
VAATLVPLADNDSPESLQLKVKLVEKVQNKNFWDQVKLSQTINPIHRTTRLILPGEEIILHEAKRLAILEYPKG